jgi:hypothetical protein
MQALVDRVGQELGDDSGRAVPNLQIDRVRTSSSIRTPEIRLAIVVSLLILAAVFASSRISAPPFVQSIALFGHLISLIVGLGSVLGVDYLGLLWFLHRLPLEVMLRHAHRISPLIWLGLCGLVLTGSLMQPQLSAPLTLIKMACVVGVGVVGVLALSTKRAMIRGMPTVSPSLLHRGLLLAALSQTLWWSAVLIGFWNM